MANARAEVSSSAAVLSAHLVGGCSWAAKFMPFGARNVLCETIICQPVGID